MYATTASVARVQKSAINFELYRFLKKRPIYPILTYLKYLSDLLISLNMMINKVKDDIPGAILH